MKKKVLNTIFILLIVSGIAVIAFYLNFLATEKRYNKEIATKLEEHYDAFKTSVRKFSEQRTIFLDATAEIYLEDLNTNYDDIISLLKEYDKAVLDVKDKAEPFEDIIKKVRLTDKSLQDKIIAFKINYEQSINYYVYDISEINIFFEEYNKLLEVNENKDLKKLPKYNAVITDYLDYNKDGIYMGKE